MQTILWLPQFWCMQYFQVLFFLGTQYLHDHHTRMKDYRWYISYSPQYRVQTQICVAVTMFNTVYLPQWAWPYWTLHSINDPKIALTSLCNRFLFFYSSLASPSPQFSNLCAPSHFISSAFSFSAPARHLLLGGDQALSLVLRNTHGSVDHLQLKRL